VTWIPVDQHAAEVEDQRIDLGHGLAHAITRVLK
jgi:hypothetical protein